MSAADMATDMTDGFHLVVEALKLEEGDQIEIRIVGTRVFEVERDNSRRRSLEKIRALRRPLPAGFRFDREAANER